MKKITGILSILFLLHNSYAQTSPITDTLGYLQSVYRNRGQFIGKPFSVLLDSLKVPIRYFSPTGTLTYDTSKETDARFYFFIPTWKAGNFDMRYIEIYWKTYLNATVSDEIFTNSNGWNNEAKEFYKNGIIKSIYVSDDIKNYNLNIPPPRWIVVSCVYKKVFVDDYPMWRYEVTKKLCNNGNLGTETQVTYSDTKVEVEFCREVY